MSDNWGHFMANIGGHNASILFDDGIANEIHTIPQNRSLLITVNMRISRDDGLPTDEEAERLSTMIQAFDKVIDNSEGVPLGQVTYNKKRYIFYQVYPDTDELRGRLTQISEECGYEIECRFRDDPNKEVYWQHLYPNKDDRRVMNDMSVISALREHGDVLTEERLVDHWTYFKDNSQAKVFADWAINNGYQNVKVEKQGGILKRSYCVRTAHVGEATIGAISKHTLAHRRRAEELGGEYDGWETFIVKTVEQ